MICLLQASVNADILTEVRLTYAYKLASRNGWLRLRASCMPLLRHLYGDVT